jgi:hypothetical protein
VLVAPVDAPYSRLTVLRDPRGATFSATAFVPENKNIGREVSVKRFSVTTARRTRSRRCGSVR